MPKKELPRITSWSYSRYQCHCICPRQAKFKYIDKLQEPDAGPDAPNVRGDRIHKGAEAFLKSKRMPAKLPENFGMFENELRDMHKRKAKAEVEWAFTDKWEPTDWFAKDAWCRIKVDVLIPPTKKDATVYVYDWKTGKVRPNHVDQMSLYALGGFLTCEDAEAAKTKLYYLDHGKDTPADFKRVQLPGLLRMWERKVQPMLTDTLYPPKPGPLCPWCPFTRDKGGPCEF